MLEIMGTLSLWIPGWFVVLVPRDSSEQHYGASRDAYPVEPGPPLSRQRQRSSAVSIARLGEGDPIVDWIDHGELCTPPFGSFYAGSIVLVRLRD